MTNNLYKRGRIFYYDFTFEGKHYNGSTGCENKKQAELILYRLRADVIEEKISPGKRKKSCSKNSANGRQIGVETIEKARMCGEAETCQASSESLH